MHCRTFIATESLLIYGTGDYVDYTESDRPDVNKPDTNTPETGATEDKADGSKAELPPEAVETAVSQIKEAIGQDLDGESDRS